MNDLTIEQQRAIGDKLLGNIAGAIVDAMNAGHGGSGCPDPREIDRVVIPVDVERFMGHSLNWREVAMVNVVLDYLSERLLITFANPDHSRLRLTAAGKQRVYHLCGGAKFQKRMNTYGRRRR